MCYTRYLVGYVVLCYATLCWLHYAVHALLPYAVQSIPEKAIQQQLWSVSNQRSSQLKAHSPAPAFVPDL